MYKLFITDLDGTLLDDQKNISEENKKALKNLKNKGIPVTIFTGRNFQSSKRYVEMLELDVPIVCQNGAFIIQPKNMEIIHNIPLKVKTVRYLESLSRDLGLDIIYFIDFIDEIDMYVENEFWHQLPYKNYMENNRYRMKITNNINDIVESKESIAQLAIVGHIDKIKILQKNIEEQKDLGLSCIFSSLINDIAFFEVFGPHVSKAKALEKIIHHYGVTKEEAVFIGDGLNDIEIMKEVGLPIAVENAVDEVKNVSRLIVDTNNNHGVAEAIYKVF